MRHQQGKIVPFTSTYRRLSRSSPFCLSTSPDSPSCSEKAVDFGHRPSARVGILDALCTEKKSFNGLLGIQRDQLIIKIQFLTKALLSTSASAPFLLRVPFVGLPLLNDNEPLT